MPDGNKKVTHTQQKGHTYLNKPAAYASTTPKQGGTTYPSF